MGVEYSDAFDVLNGEGCPQGTKEAATIEKWNTNNWDIFSILFFATNGLANTLLRQFEGKKKGSGLGDGAVASLSRSRRSTITAPKRRSVHVTRD